MSTGRIVETKLRSTTRYSQSKHFSEPRGERETSADHEKRCWRMRMHVTSDGRVMIPPSAFKNCLSEAAKYESIQIPGKGKATYTKHFEAGVLCFEPLVLDTLAKDVKGEELFVPADGRRGGGKRVEKIFPSIDEWSGTVQWLIVDPAITPEVFARVLEVAGNMIGIGRFRPRNNGWYGRFEVESILWK